MAGNYFDYDLFVIGFSSINFSIGLLDISKTRFAHGESPHRILVIETIDMMYEN